MIYTKFLLFLIKWFTKSFKSFRIPLCNIVVYEDFWSQMSYRLKFDITMSRIPKKEVESTFSFYLDINTFSNYHEFC